MYHYNLSLDGVFEGSSYLAADQVSEARSSQAGTPDNGNLDFSPAGFKSPAGRGGYRRQGR